MKKQPKNHSLGKKITFIVVFGIILTTVAVFLSLSSLGSIQETFSRYAFTANGQDEFKSSPFYFGVQCDGSACTNKTIYSDEAVSFSVNNFVNDDFNTKDTSYIISITDGNGIHDDYNFAINGVAIDSTTDSVTRTIAGGAAISDTLNLTFQKTNTSSTNNTVTVKIISTGIYEGASAEFTITLKTKVNTVTVTFDPNEGTVSPTTTVIEQNNTYGSGTGLNGSLPTPTSTGAIFLGWFEEGYSWNYEYYYDNNNLSNDGLTKDYDSVVKYWINHDYNEGTYMPGLIKSTTTMTKTTNHTLHAEWAYTLTVVSSATTNKYSESGDMQYIECYDHSNNLILEASSELTTSSTTYIKYFDTPLYKTTMVTCTSYPDANNISEVASDTLYDTDLSLTINISNFTAQEDKLPINLTNTDRTTATTGIVYNTRAGCYSFELWGGYGGQGGYGTTWGTNPSSGGSAGHVYGKACIDYKHRSSFAYSIGGNGSNGNYNTMSGSGQTGGANGGGSSESGHSYEAGSGGGYTALYNATSSTLFALAAGGGGGGGSGNTSGSVVGGAGGNGATTSSTVTNNVTSSFTSGGTTYSLSGFVFTGTNGANGGNYSTSTNYFGTGGSTVGGTNNAKNGLGGSLLTGGNGDERGGGGGGGYYGGAAGYSYQRNIFSGGGGISGGGGGGSSFLDSSFTYSGLTSSATNTSTTGGAIIITYIGKSL